MQTSQVKLRQTEIADLEFFYQFQLDEEANYVAAFTPKNNTDKKGYIEKYTRFLHDSTINTQTILADESIVGSIAKFKRAGNAELTYWLARSCWNRGVATLALQNFLFIEKARPLFARVAFDNLGSRRVLEKCGFVKIGTDQGYANARQAEIVEFIYKLA